MNRETLIFFLVVGIFLLCLVILYQRYAYGRGIRAKLREMSGKLKEILETGSDEQVMVFTENSELMEPYPAQGIRHDPQ